MQAARSSALASTIAHYPPGPRASADVFLFLFGRTHVIDRARLIF